MSDELLFTVSASTASPARSVSLADVGLTEREHLQEWVIANPSVVGDDVRILAFEFDRWLSASGDRERDRLDVLGIDTSGHLVVAELKRDRAPTTVELQAIKYAALVSRFDEDTIAAAHADFLTRRGAITTPDQARQLIEDHISGELEPDLLRRPKIVIIAGEFLPVTTASCVWLTEMGLDISLVQYRAYRAGSELVVSVSVLWPIRTVEEFTVSPQLVEGKAAARKTSRRQTGSAVKRIINAHALSDGTELLIRPTTEVDGEARAQIDAWLEEDPTRGCVTWRNDPSAPLVWAHDDQAYTPTGLARLVITEGAGFERSPRGPSWFVTEEGDDLVSIADAVSPALPGSSGESRDWSDLHRLLKAVEPGTWTTYGALAAAIGSSAIAVGQHVTKCSECVNAYRVLSSSRRVSPGFQWTDPSDERDPQDVLREEGVRFSDDGRADPSQQAAI